MANVLTIRKGCKARLTLTHYNMWGSPIRTEKHVVTILDNPRDERGRYCSPRDWRASVKVRTEVGDEFDTDCDNLSVYNTMATLTHEDYVKLRGEVCLCSCYLADYRNSFGIDENEVYNTCEGFGESTDWDDALDTPENFADYCDEMEWAA